MPGTTNPTKTLDRVIAIAAAYSGIQAVDQGYRRFADVENFEATVQAYVSDTQGYAAFWLKEVSIAENEALPAKIVGELVMARPKDVSNNMDASWDYAIGLANALAADANYLPGESKPFRIDFSLYKIDTQETAGLIFFDFGARGNGGIHFLDP